MSKPSRKKGTIALIISSYSSLIIAIVKGLVLIPIYLYYIDDRLYGAWLATGSIIAYLGLLDFGLNNVLLQRVASSYGENNFNLLGSILGTGLVIGFFLSLLPIFAGLIFSGWITSIVKVSGDEASQLRSAFIIAAVGTSLMLAMYNVGGVLAALQRQAIHGFFLVLGDITGILITVFLLIAGYGLLSIPLGTLTWALISFSGDGLYLWWFIEKKLADISIKFKVKEAKDLFLQSAWQFGSRSAVTATRESDNLIIAILTDPKLCTIFTLTKKASEMLALLVRNFIGAFLPGLAHLHGEGDKEKFKKITIVLFKMTSLSGICLIGGYLFLNKQFVRLWVGSEFFGGMILTALLCVSALFIIFSTFFYNVIFAKGEMSTAAKANIAEAFIRIPLCIVLVMLWGIKGAALAAVLAVIPTSLLIQAKKCLVLLNLSKKDFLNYLKIMVFQILLALITGIILKSIWKPEGINEFLFWGAFYMTIVIIFCTYFDKELRSIVLDFKRAFLEKFVMQR
jgi:O-antigen/teichoic acid export membrane protein